VGREEIRRKHILKSNFASLNFLLLFVTKAIKVCVLRFARQAKSGRAVLLIVLMNATTSSFELHAEKEKVAEL